MKTAMQEHIDWLQSTLEICEEHATPLINCLKLCISDAESKLEIEKRQIENAYWDGGQDIPLSEQRCKQYYNKTFKSE